MFYQANRVTSAPAQNWRSQVTVKMGIDKRASL